MEVGQRIKRVSQGETFYGIITKKINTDMFIFDLYESVLNRPNWKRPVAKKCILENKSGYCKGCPVGDYKRCI